METGSLPRALICLSLLLVAGTALAGETVTRDGNTHVLNQEPALPPVTLQLEELWRAGGEDNADDLVFGVPVEALADENGRVYLADQQLCQVFVFETDGIRFLGDGRILLIKGFVVSRLACLGSGNATLGDDDTGTLEIVCYRLPGI